MIAPHIFALSLFLSLVWLGVALAEIGEYREARGNGPRAAVVRELRDLVMSICLLSVSMAYLFRTSVVLLGFGDAIAGQVAFFALVGTNVVGGIFCVLSLRYD